MHKLRIAISSSDESTVCETTMIITNDINGCIMLLLLSFRIFGLSLYTKDLYLAIAPNLIFLLLHEIQRISGMKSGGFHEIRQISHEIFNSQRGQGGYVI